MFRNHKNLMTNKFAGISYPVTFDCGKAVSEVIGLARKIFVDPNNLRMRSSI